MTESTIPKLEARSIIELLDHAFQLFRNNFWTFIAIVAVTQIPVTILSILSNLPFYLASTTGYEGAFAGRFAETFIGFLITAVVSVIANGFSIAAITRAVADSYLGKSIGFLEAYRKIGNDWSRLIKAMLLSGVLSLGIAVWMVIPCVGWISGFGMLMFYTMIIAPLVAPVIVLEKQTASNALNRAWELAHRRFWELVKFAALLAFISLVIVSGPSTLIQFVLQTVLEGTSNVPLGTANTTPYIVQMLIQLLLNLIYQPVSLTAMTLLYFDLRVRTEGFDLAWLVGHALDEEAPDPDTLVEQAPEPSRKVLSMTKHEFGQYVLLSLGAGLLYFVLVAVVGIVSVGVIGAFGGGF